MASKLYLIFCIISLFSIWASSDASRNCHAAPAPAPAVDCSSLVLNMVDCLSFVSNGSTTTKPEGSCCSGLKTVLKTDSECLCEAFKSSAQLGAVLNVTKALSLPSACKLHDPSVPKCGLGLSSSGSPGTKTEPLPIATSHYSSSMASKLYLIFCIISLFSIWVSSAGNRHAAPAPAPAVDCSSLVLNMVDCLSFVSNGSTTTKPEGSCCSGLKTVLKTDSECLCEAFKSSAQLGAVLNVTKALSLPSACKLHDPSAPNCGLGLSSSGSPASSPSLSPAAGPSGIPGLNVQAPSPAPATGGSIAVSISAVSLVIGLVIASLSSF